MIQANGVLFGEYHSYNDLQLILSNKTIGTPSPKTEVIDIPGGDGVLDLTEFFGDIKYNNRTLSFEFSTIVPKAQFMEQFARIQHLLHGRKMKIALDADPEWYYIGRITVSEWKADKNIGKLTIDCDCEPFKNKLTSQAVNLSGRNLLDLNAGTPVLLHESAWTKTETGYSFSRGSVEGGSFLYFSIPVKKGQKYVFSADYEYTAQILYVYKDKLYGTAVASGKPCIFTAQETGVYLFGLYCSSGLTECEFRNVMIQEGNSVGEYVAYDSTEKTLAVTFSNTRKTAIPTAYVSGDISVENPSNYQLLTPGENTLTSFPFYEGDTTLTFKGHGYTVMEWLERGL